MHDVSKKARIKNLLINVFCTPFISFLYILCFPFLIFIKIENASSISYTIEDKFKVLLFCFYSLLLYPIFIFHYIFIMNPNQYIRHIKENFMEEIERRH